MSVLVYDCGSVANTITATLDTSTGAMIIRGTGDIDNYANEYSPWYSDRESITQVTVDKGITRIGTGTFYNCTNLEYISIPKTVTSIGSDVFNSCTSLESIKIPKSVTTIGNSAFADSGLTEIKFFGNPPEAGTDILDNVTATGYVPEGNTEWDSLAKAEVAGNGSTITWSEFDTKPNLLEYDELDYFWSKIKKWVNDNKSNSSLPIIDDKTFIKYLTLVISDSNHTNTSTTLYVNNPEYFAENDCFYVKKDSTHFFYGIVSAVNNNTGALTYAIPSNDGGVFFSPDDGQLIVNYGNPMNGGVYLDWANDRVDLYQNYTELERYYNIYDPILNINAWDSTTAGIAEEDGVVDVSGNDNHGQAFGGVAVVKDKVMGRCFSFDGVDDYLSFPSMVNMLQNLDGCTFTFKIKINALPSSYANVFGGIVGGANILSCRVNSGGSIYITTPGADGKNIAANQLLTINDIFSVCFVLDYSNSLAKVYINGSLSNQVEWYSSSPTEVLDCFGIGAKVQTDSSYFWLNGEISDFRFFDKALTSEQIKVIYNQSLVTQYLNSNIYNPILNLDADYSTTASIAVADGVIDVSGNHNNGQAYGGVTVVKDAEMGDCFSFDGTDDYLLINNSNLTSLINTLSELTITCTIKVSALPSTTAYSVAAIFPSAYSCAGLGIRNGKLAIMGRRITGQSLTAYESEITPELDKVYIMAGVYDFSNGKIKLFLDGEFSGEADLESTGVITGVTAVDVGALVDGSSASYTFNGFVNDVRLFPRCLSASEVYNVYQQSLNPEAFENPEKLLSYNEINIHHFDNNSLVQDNMFRLGNLNGVPGISDNRPGVFIGGENEYIRYDKLNGLRIKGTAEKAETAQLAKQLGTTTIGNPTTPIYLVNGNPTECELEAGGGRNLLSNTSMSEVSFTAAITNYNLTSFAIDSIQGNDYIVISFEAKASISRWIDFYWIDSGGTSHSTNSFSINPAFNLTTEYKRYYGIFKCMEMDYTLSKLRIRQSSSEHGLAASGATIYIKKLKVEFGKAPSTWTPAPEDTVPSATNATNATTATNANNAKLTHTVDDTYYPIVLGSSAKIDDSNQSLRIGCATTTLLNCALRGKTYYGAANTQGESVFVVGNNIAKTSANNSRGGLTLYGTGAYYLHFRSGDVTANRTINLLGGSADVTLTMPSSTGTLALTSSDITGNAATATTASKVNVGIAEAGAYYALATMPYNATSGSAYAMSRLQVANSANDAALYFDANATSGNQRVILKLGNATANTTAAGHNGVLRLYGTSTGYTDIVPGAPTSSSPNTLTLPTSTGTIALTSSDITGNAATATKLATARNIGISDSDGTNTGTAASFNGTAAVTIKLPSTIKASITGNADSSTYATNVRITPSDGTTEYAVTMLNGSTASTNYALRTAVNNTTVANSGLRCIPGADVAAGTEGVTTLCVGNKLKSADAADNRTGKIRLYGNSSGYTTIAPGYNSTSNITLTLPSSAGTLALKSDITAAQQIPSNGSSATTVQNLTNTSSVSNTSCTLMLVMVYCISNDVNATLKNGSTTLLNNKAIHVRGVDGAGRYAGGSTTTFLLLKNDTLTLSANADNIFTRVIVA